MNWRMTGVAALALGLAGCVGTDGLPRMVAACEEIVKGSLRSPRSYERISVTNRTEEGSNTLHAAIRYEAMNAFGVPVRGYVDCEFESRDGTDGRAAGNNVLVNGHGDFDWVLNGPYR